MTDLPTVEEVLERWQNRKIAIDKAIKNPDYQYFKYMMQRRLTLRANEPRTRKPDNE